MRTKLEDVLEMTRINELLNKKDHESANKPSNVILWVLAVIGAIAAVAAIAFTVYRYMTPEYEDDYDDDDFDDDFEEDFEDAGRDLEHLGQSGTRRRARGSERPRAVAGGSQVCLRAARGARFRRRADEPGVQA